MTKIIISFLVVVAGFGFYVGSTDTMQNTKIKNIEETVQGLGDIEGKIDTMNANLNAILLRMKVKQ